jgi:ribosomal protein S8
MIYKIKALFLRCKKQKSSANPNVFGCIHATLLYSGYILVSSKLTEKTVEIMTKEKFIEHFKLLLVHLREVTEKFCFNAISENYTFILEPSERTSSQHLTKEENEYLKIWNKLENKEINFDQVVDLFYKNGKTPKWADCTINLSTSEKTVVKIYFSRQFKDEKEIYYLERGTGPFKAVVNTSSQNVKDSNGKFDVNWKSELEEKKSKSLLTKIKIIFTK